MNNESNIKDMGVMNTYEKNGNYFNGYNNIL